jgi:hypothetical protein
LIELQIKTHAAELIIRVCCTDDAYAALPCWMLYHSPILVRYLLPGLLQMPEMADVAALNLSARYERQVLASAQQHGSASGNPNTVVPAIVITGFLGSGKTTLVRHLLRQTVYVLSLLHWPSRGPRMCSAGSCLLLLAGVLPALQSLSMRQEL